jgi:hypothetical protein
MEARWVMLTNKIVGLMKKMQERGTQEGGKLKAVAEQEMEVARGLSISYTH